MASGLPYRYVRFYENLPCSPENLQTIRNARQYPGFDFVLPSISAGMSRFQKLKTLSETLKNQKRNSRTSEKVLGMKKPRVKTRG